LVRFLFLFFLIGINISLAQVGLYGNIYLGDSHSLAVNNVPLYFFNGTIQSESDTSALAFLGSAQALDARQQSHSEVKTRITAQEVDVLLSQNAIPSRKVLGGSLPQVFTEYGVLQLANILRSEKAVEMSILIIEAFVALRQHAQKVEALAAALKKLENSTHRRFSEVGKVLDALMKQKHQQDNQQHHRRIGFKQGDP